MITYAAGSTRKAVGVEKIDLRILVVTLTTAFYALTFAPLFEDVGPGVLALSAVPVALAGWLFGLRAGLIFGTLAFPLNTALLWSAQSTDFTTVVWGGGVAGSAALLVGAVAGTLRDVSEQLHRELTDRQLVEADLRESEERLRHLVESAPATLITVDRNGTVLYSSAPLGAVGPGEARGTTVFDYIPDDHHHLFRTALDRVFSEGVEAGYEITDYDPGQTTAHIIRLGPVKQAGRVTAATLIGIDVVEERFADE